MGGIYSPHTPQKGSRHMARRDKWRNFEDFGSRHMGAVDKALKVIIQKVRSFGSEPFVALDKNAKIWYNISIESEGYKC